MRTWGHRGIGERRLSLEPGVLKVFVVMLVLSVLFSGCRKEPVESGLIGKWEIRQLDSVRLVDMGRLDTFRFCGGFRDHGWIEFRADSFGFISDPVRMATCGEDRFIWEAQNQDSEIHFYFFADTTRAFIDRTDTDHMVLAMRNFCSTYGSISPVYYRYDLIRTKE
jgi:hypothetical protein